MYGLVLEGGGAKGSYQIGACRALKDLGVEISGVAGTSIGAINGAMIAQGDLDLAYDLWYDISPSKVFGVLEDKRLNDIKKNGLTPDNLQYLLNKARDILNNRGLDTTLMRKILEENIKEDKLRASKKDFGLVTISLTDLKPLEIFLEDIPRGEVVDYLLAGASLPVFRLARIDDKVFLDGGFYDNMPVNLLRARGYKDYIVIRTHGLGRVRKIEGEQELHIISIEPSEDLGLILDFNQETIRKNLKLGYYDALKVFRGLKGRDYYIQPVGEEGYYTRLLLDLDEENIRKTAQILGLSGMPPRRLLMERIIPRLMELLNIKKEAGYEEIVLLCLEELAGLYGLERFKVYDVKDFVAEIKRRYHQGEVKKEPEPGYIPFLAGFLRQSGLLPGAGWDDAGARAVLQLFAGFAR